MLNTPFVLTCCTFTGILVSAQTATGDELSRCVEILRRVGVGVEQIQHIDQRTRAWGGLSTVSGAKDEHVAMCHSIPDLTTLDLDGCIHITERGFRNIKSFNKLQWLSVERTSFSNESLNNLRDLSDLRGLYLSDTLIDDNGLAKLGHLHQLSELALNLTDVQGWGLEHLSRLRSLNCLSLSATQLTDTNLKFVADLRLVQLYLKQTKISDHGAHVIGELSSLRVLDVSESDIGDGSIRNFRRLRNLKELDLSYTAISDKAIPYISECKELCELSLSGTRVGDGVITELNRIPGLTVLRVEGTHISESGIARLRLPALKYIWVSGQLSPKTMRILRSKSPECTIITEK